MVLTASFALSLVTGLSCHHHPCDAKHHHALNASVGASGPHDFSVRSDAVRLTTSKRPSHSCSNVRGDRAYAPPAEQDGQSKQVIWLRTQARYFSHVGWTCFEVICPSGRWGYRQHRPVAG